jgi:hypothetical protein
MKRLVAATMAMATVALAFTSLTATPMPSAFSQAVPFALEVQTQPFQSPPFQSPQAQPKATQVQAPATAPAAPVVVAPAATNVQADTKISVGSAMSDIFYAAMTLFGSTIGAALTAVLLKLLGGIGDNMTVQRKEQLQKLVERGLMLAAAGAKKTLDGKLTVDVKNQVVADAVRYAQSHGADLLKKLGEKPDAAHTVEALEARAETALADPAVPIEVAPAPAVPAETDIKAIVREQMLELLKEMRAAQSKTA